MCNSYKRDKYGLWLPVVRSFLKETHVWNKALYLYFSSCVFLVASGKWVAAGWVWVRPLSPAVTFWRFYRDTLARYSTEILYWDTRYVWWEISTEIFWWDSSTGIRLVHKDPSRLDFLLCCVFVHQRAPPCYVTGCLRRDVIADRRTVWVWRQETSVATFAFSRARILSTWVCNTSILDKSLIVTSGWNRTRNVILEYYSYHISIPEWRILKTVNRC